MPAVGLSWAASEEGSRCRAVGPKNQRPSQASCDWKTKEGLTAAIRIGGVPSWISQVGRTEGKELHFLQKKIGIEAWGTTLGSAGQGASSGESPKYISERMHC